MGVAGVVRRRSSPILGTRQEAFSEAPVAQLACHGRTRGREFGFPFDLRCSEVQHPLSGRRLYAHTTASTYDLTAFTATPGNSQRRATR